MTFGALCVTLGGTLGDLWDTFGDPRGAFERRWGAFL